ncbi:TPA: hypothetical protein ACQ7XC_004611 [Escherichia coli]
MSIIILATISTTQEHK